MLHSYIYVYAFWLAHHELLLFSVAIDWIRVGLPQDVNVLVEKFKVFFSKYLIIELCGAVLSNEAKVPECHFVGVSVGLSDALRILLTTHYTHFGFRDRVRCSVSLPSTASQIVESASVRLLLPLGGVE